MKCDKCNGTGQVAEPVPEWITKALAGHWTDHVATGGEPCKTCQLRAEVVYRHFRAHVAERARKISTDYYPQTAAIHGPQATGLYDAIVAEMLR